MLWFGAIVLLLQLFAAVGHDHEVESQAQDCVACSLHAQSQAAPPSNPSAPAAAWVLVQLVAAPVIVERLAPHASYLLPQPHAPPVLLDLA